MMYEMQARWCCGLFPCPASTQKVRCDGLPTATGHISRCCWQWDREDGNHMSRSVMSFKSYTRMYKLYPLWSLVATNQPMAEEDDINCGIIQIDGWDTMDSAIRILLLGPMLVFKNLEISKRDYQRKQSKIAQDKLSLPVTKQGIYRNHWEIWTVSSTGQTKKRQWETYQEQLILLC